MRQPLLALAVAAVPAAFVAGVIVGMWLQE